MTYIPEMLFIPLLNCWRQPKLGQMHMKRKHNPPGQETQETQQETQSTSGMWVGSGGDLPQPLLSLLLFLTLDLRVGVKLVPPVIVQPLGHVGVSLGGCTRVRVGTPGGGKTHDLTGAKRSTPAALLMKNLGWVSPHTCWSMQM